MTTLLIDSDIVAYKESSAGERRIKWGDEEDEAPLIISPDLEDVKRGVDVAIGKYMAVLGGTRAIVCLSCPSSENWRLKVLPSYKANRLKTIKPLHLVAAKQYMRDKYETYERPTLEADDIMGILQTHPGIVKGRKVIVSEDKDMQTIPGYLCNPRIDTKARFIEKWYADTFHMYQTLVGDTTDNYKGAPGIGSVKAERILRKTSDAVMDMWVAVVDAYQKAMQCEDRAVAEAAALVQARVARILRASDYNFKTKEVILWNPV